MARIEETIEIDVSLLAAYTQWTRFEEYPRFMKQLYEVNRLGDGKLEWRAEVAGERIAWITSITRHDDERQIGWRGAFDEASVQFKSIAADRTRVTLEIQYALMSLPGRGSGGFRFASAPAAGDLRRFKEFIETGVVVGEPRAQAQAGLERPKRSVGLFYRHA